MSISTTPILNKIIFHDSVPFSVGFPTNKALYDFQCDRLLEYIVLGSSHMQSVNTATVFINEHSIISKFKWPNKGELISGSSVAANTINTLYNDNTQLVQNNAKDIDIFFKSKNDAMEFLRINNLFVSQLSNPMCAYVYADMNMPINIIYGVEFKDEVDLISGFDIRACSIAVDPNTLKLTAVVGAITDALNKVITFNPTPRNCSIKRLVKYSQRGWSISGYQSKFFAELLNSKIYNPEIELFIGY
jgi:hypothetical protein